ncbi:hypothetical protein [Agrococcus sp. SGAir0287]|uniref:hypothetical protein n=1 Tax=Agrococcus sp. SGAir0287 TaxID=2070347 RepID=UPI0010CD07BF|nr:hypothetical protein [Agrococcus sp. SGAir0287]QCR18413.1 hypothetical protein C1N71_02235 [Agrococcus sp. SGAir0287]
MDDTRSHLRGRRDEDDAGATPDGLLAAFTHLGVCVIGTHDPRRAADAWRDLMDRRRGHAVAPGTEPAARRLDASAWWHAQHRWARRGRRGWVLVRDRADGAEPAMVLVGVFRD